MFVTKELSNKLKIYHKCHKNIRGKFAIVYPTQKSRSYTSFLIQVTKFKFCHIKTVSMTKLHFVAILAISCSEHTINPMKLKIKIKINNMCYSK